MHIRILNIKLASGRWDFYPADMLELSQKLRLNELQTNSSGNFIILFFSNNRCSCCSGMCRGNCQRIQRNCSSEGRSN